MCIILRSACWLTLSCVLLMSLDQNASIPVDRHVFQFAERWYHFRSKRYEDIAEKFRALWGERAGWAHTVRHISFSTCYLTC